jgi:trk system potassium uptake protein TrkA
MNIIVVGCGRVGSALAYQLSKKGHQVAVIDQAASAFGNLPADFRGRLEDGDVLVRETLQRAGIEHADALAAVTSSDAVNVVVAHVARVEYHVPNVVARNYDSVWRPLYEAFGLPVVSPTGWGARRIEEMLLSPSLQAVFSPGNAEVKIYELVVPEHWRGRSTHELLPEGQCVTAVLSHAGRAALPTDALQLEAGDVVYLSATPEGVAALQQRLSQKQEGV